MNNLVRKSCVTMVLLFILSSSGRAEVRAPLQHYVELADLIVKCKIEVEGNMVKYRVMETWKGRYSPDLFYHNPDLVVPCFRPPDGYVKVQKVTVKEQLPANAQEVVLFYSFDHAPSWTHGKLLGASKEFEVREGKIVYPSWSDPPPPPPLGTRKDYASDEEFTKAKLRHLGYSGTGLRNVWKEYTVAEFKHAVLRAAGKDGDPTKMKATAPKRD